MSVISSLKDCCAPGPDGLEAKFIKLASQVLIYLLCGLFNLPLFTCNLPSIWKCAKVTPLHKGGDPLDTDIYRPISIICTVTKIFEKLVFNQLSQYVNDSYILSPFQSAHGKFTYDIFSSLGKSQFTGAIFIDLRGLLI